MKTIVGEWTRAGTMVRYVVLYELHGSIANWSGELHLRGSDRRKFIGGVITNATDDMIAHAVNLFPSVDLSESADNVDLARVHGRLVEAPNG